MYKASDIAKYVVQMCCEKDKPISNLQLQKILYYVQGYFFKKFKECAFDEKIYNWTYGPVVPDVYFEYNIYGGQKINDVLDDESPVSLMYASKEHRRCIENVVTECLKYSAGALVSKTHSEDPWHDSIPRSEISSQSVKDYFEKNDPLNLS